MGVAKQDLAVHHLTQFSNSQKIVFHMVIWIMRWENKMEYFHMCAHKKKKKKKKEEDILTWLGDQMWLKKKKVTMMKIPILPLN